MTGTSYLRISCFLLLLWLAKPERIVYLNEDGGNNSPHCLPLPDTNKLKHHNACKSLDYVASKIGHDSIGLTIVIETDLLLNGLVIFSNCSSLTITSADEEDGVVLTANRTANVVDCGLCFTDVLNLTLSGVTVSQCEHRPREELINMNRRVAVHVHQVTGLTIRFFSVSQISGTGLVISDTGGQVAIESSTFTDNCASAENISTNNVFAGGIHMQFGEKKVVQGDIVVKNCIFENNLQPKSISIDPVHYHHSDFQTLYGYGTGGGMGILFMGDTEGISITLEGCTFANNTANWGAGLYVHFQDNTTNNSLTVANSVFGLENSANAGGGMCVGLARLNRRAETFNRVFVVNTIFTRNEAHYGGGTSLFAIHSTDFSPNRKEMVYFSNCTWESNKAYYSSAIDLSAFQHDHFNVGFLPVPKFSQCNFTKNRLNHTTTTDTKYRTSGVFAVTSFEVQFEGTNLFMENRYTSLQLTSATVILEEGAVMIFDSNEGLRGAAIAMYGFSSLKGNNNCAMEFRNNSAKRVGGGIYYQPFDQREIFGGQSCFIQYIGNSSERNYTFTFSNNTAALGGTSIFAVSFHSCFFYYHGSLDNKNLSSFFNEIGTFQFDDSSVPLATEGNMFVLEEHSSSFSAIPGELLHIPLSVRDEFNRTTQTPIGLEIHSSGHETGETTFYYFTHNRTRVYGKPNEIKKLVFNTQNTRDAYYDKITVNLTDCPPGYWYEGKNHSCVCSADDKQISYHGINKCNASVYRAYIDREYWAGYLYGNLYTGPCAFKVCHINSNTSHRHLLPMSEDKLILMMCGDSKMGILCGMCVTGYSAYFHSNPQKCGPNDKCSLGVLFYFLSEVVPVVILFSLIIHFDISFTTGGISGLVFFSQMILTTPTDMEKIMHRQDNTTVELFKNIQYGYTLIYSILNLNFFSIDKLSFCLWRSASPMQVLAFNFVTTSFALILVWVLARIMNSRWYMRWNKNNQPRSVVHGLSAFLVLSFSQCITVSFQILSQNVIQSNHEVDKTKIKVTHYGGLLYLDSDHLPFVIIATFFLICIGLIPPLLLLLYPLFLQLLSFCELSEHRITQGFLKAVHIHRLTPLFDSFQSCYKDKLRFFAGLYFVYKICILFCRSYTNNLIELLAGLEGIIFIVLGIHAIVQPYKERSHNIVDSCLFFNLGFINGINIYTNYIALEDGVANLEYQMVAFCTIQMILIYIPIIGVFFWCIRKLIKKRQHRQYQRLDSFPQDNRLLSPLRNFCVNFTSFLRMF